MKAPWFSNKQWTWSGLKCVQVSPCAISPNRRGVEVISEGRGHTLGGANFFETSIPHFKTYFLQIGCCYLYNRRQFKTFDPNKFSLSSVFSFQNVWPIKKAIYTLLLFHIIIRSFPWTTCLFFKTYVILVNLQAVVGGKKCCLRRENVTGYRLIRRRMVFCCSCFVFRQ